MADKVDATKFYQFLTTFKKDDKTWIDAADSNEDGTVIKAEFRTFLKENADAFKELTGVAIGEDIINNFWNTIDSNKNNRKIEGTKLKNLNALDNDELVELNKSMEAYIEFEQFCKNLKAPTQLTGNRATMWKKLVREQLEIALNEFLAAKTAGSVTEFLNTKLAEIKNTITAGQCDDEYKEQLKNNVLKKYEQYQIDEDPILNSLIDAYVDKIDMNAADQDIYNGMVNLIDAYLATAGIKPEKANLELLKKYGYEPDSNSSMNNLQTEVLKKDLKDKLVAELQNDEIFKRFPAVLTKALESFVQEIADGTTFATFNTTKTATNIEQFKATAVYQNITKVLNCFDTNKDSAFYKALSDALSYTNDKTGEAKMTKAIEKLAELPEFTQAIEDICNNLDNYLTNGAVDVNKVINEVIGKVSDSILKAAEVVFSKDDDLPTTSVKFNDYVEDASHIKDTNTKLEKNKEILIRLCNAIYDKNEALKKQVIQLFGSDYTSKINSMTEAQVSSAIKQVQAMLDKYALVENCKLSSWGTIPSEITVGKGLVYTGILDAIVKDGENTVPSNRVTYQLNGGTVSALTIKGDKAVSERYDVLAVLVDGVVIATKEIKVITKSVTTDEILKGIQDWGATPKASDQIGVMADGKYTPVTNSNFNDLYNNDSVIRLDYNESKNYSDWEHRRSTVRANLTTLVDNIISALASAGLDKSVLDKVKSQVVNSYINNGRVLFKKSKGSGSEGALINKTLDALTNPQNNSASRHRIIDFVDTTSADSHLYSVRFKDVVDDVIAAYNKEVGTIDGNNNVNGGNNNTENNTDVDTHNSVETREVIKNIDAKEIAQIIGNGKYEIEVTANDAILQPSGESIYQSLLNAIRNSLEKDGADVANLETSYAEAFRLACGDCKGGSNMIEDFVDSVLRYLVQEY